MKKENIERYMAEVKIKTKMEIMAQEIKPIFEKMHKQDEENRRRGYYIKNGRRKPIPKSVRQFIVKTEKNPTEKQEEINNFLQENFSDLLAKQVC